MEIMEITASSFSQQFIQILDDISKRLGVAINWTSANITPYLTELISRYSKFIVVEKGIYTIASLTLFIIGIYFISKNFKTAIKVIYECQFEDYKELQDLILWIISIILLIIGVLAFSINLPNFIKSLYIPEYYILESIKGLL